MPTFCFTILEELLSSTMNDFELALQLQKELNEVADSTPKVQNYVSTIKSCPTSLVNPSWELIDPNPDARSLFLQFNEKYFWGRLAGVEVRWSPRMTMCAGLCCYEGRGGLCSIRLSKPLLQLRPRKDLVETLLHEMIHAYLFVTENNKDHDGHGPEFHKHMYRINKDGGTKISVYHNFHDEVAHYKQHWWKCDGPCQQRPPYHGLVKRAMNRAPSSNDFWWAEHQKTCGGTYHKIKEPEGYGQKKSTKKPKEEKSPKRTGLQDIRGAFSQGKSQATGSISKKKTSSPVKQPPPLPNIPITSNGNIKNDALEVKQSSPATMFPGQGKTLSGSSNRSANGPIVRKIPGIGIISNERPLNGMQGSGNSANNGDNNGDDNSDDDIILYSPDAVNDTSARLTQSPRSSLFNTSITATNTLINRKEASENIQAKSRKTLSPSVLRNSTSAHNRKRSMNHVFDSDSEKEFDGLLNSMKRQKQEKKVKKLRKSTKSSSLTNLRDRNPATIGSCQKITNFISVCNPDSPRVLKDRVQNSPELSSPENVYKRGEKVTNFVLNRNKRAHDLIGSDSEEDNTRPFVSNVMKRRKHDDWLPAKSENGSKNLISIKSKPSASISKPPSASISKPPQSLSNQDNAARIMTSQGTLSNQSTCQNQYNVKSSSSTTNSQSNISKSSNKGTNSHITKETTSSTTNPINVVVKDETRIPQSDMAGVDVNDIALVPCPVCQTKILATVVNEHLDACLGMI